MLSQLLALRTLYGTVLTCMSRIQPIKLANIGRPFDVFRGRNELFRPPINHDVESCMLVNDNDDEQLIGVDPLTESVPVPERLSCLAMIVVSTPVSTLSEVVIDTVSAPALNVNSSRPFATLSRIKSR